MLVLICLFAAADRGSQGGLQGSFEHSGVFAGWRRDADDRFDERVDGPGEQEASAAVRARSGNELSTNLLFLMVTREPASFEEASPVFPEMGLLGAGGAVVPVVSLSVIGLELEPM